MMVLHGKHSKPQKLRAKHKWITMMMMHENDEEYDRKRQNICEHDVDRVRSGDLLLACCSHSTRKMFHMLKEE